MKRRFVLTAACLLAVLAAAPLWAAEPSVATAPAQGEEKEQSLSEINKKLTNPVSEIWSITFQQNNYILDMGPGKSDRWNSNLNFQPVLPVALTDDWNLITRPAMTLFNSVPYPNPHDPSDTERTTGFGDTVLLEMVSPSPKVVGNWLLGIGPSFIFPTASSTYTGQGKYQVGPGAVVGYLSKKWILGAFVQNWTAFGGSGNRPNTNQMNLQPIANYFLPDGWSIGYSGNILANWKASGEDVWTVPIGLSIAKVFKFGRLPVRFALAGQYMPIHPDVGGQKWNIQLLVAPVIPKLIKGNLF
jgi:hypothetical protein